MKDLYQNRIRITVSAGGEVAEYGHVFDPDMLESLRAVGRKREMAHLSSPHQDPLAFHELDEAIKKRDMVIQHLSSAVAHALADFFSKEE